MTRRRKRYEPRPLHQIFLMIDMKGGDRTQCWPWMGALSPNPIWVWNGKRRQARRVVYGLRHGMHPDDVPRITTTCKCIECLNPDHLIPRDGPVDKLLRYEALSCPSLPP